jgi:PTS system mannose-specific IID component
MITPWLPLRTRVAMLARLMTLQGSYNYETLIGNGVAFAMEPALRLLPGGRGGDAYCDAMAREGRYFNSHPYLAAVAVGALARAELSLEPPERIERFRTAMCGPLGSVGDRLVWAAWLPLCSLIALLAFGLGATASLVVALFLVVYNSGHLALRVWGLHAGWRDGLAVAGALAAPVFRTGPATLTRLAAFACGAGMPAVIGAAAGVRPTGVLVIAALGALGALVLTLLHGRVAGWRVATWLLALSALAAVLIR